MDTYEEFAADGRARRAAAVAAEPAMRRLQSNLAGLYRRPGGIAARSRVWLTAAAGTRLRLSMAVGMAASRASKELGR